ncbi:hcp domain protein, partial [Vibrio cholerae O1 str. NHCC-004A]
LLKGNSHANSMLYLYRRPNSGSYHCRCMYC